MLGFEGRFVQGQGVTSSGVIQTSGVPKLAEKNDSMKKWVHRSMMGPLTKVGPLEGGSVITPVKMAV